MSMKDHSVGLATTESVCATGIDWEDAFSNAAYIPDALRFPQRWITQAAEFREQNAGELDISYGENTRETFDLFFPTGVSKGLAIFIHGGYWVDFDKSSWSHLAEGCLKHNWTVMLPGYSLAPEVTIPEITAQISHAITKAAGRIEGPIRIAGHSAGGHLATRMICENTPLSKDVTSRIRRVVSISGLHDLRPLLRHSMNQQLRLTEDIAGTESPALQAPVPDVEVIAWLGEHERPEFFRQSALLAENWRGQVQNMRLIIDRQRHHFNVIEGLEDRVHPLTRALAGNG